MFCFGVIEAEHRKSGKWESFYASESERFTKQKRKRKMGGFLGRVLVVLVPCEVVNDGEVI